MAELRATPYANPLTGLTNDAIQGLLAFMQDKRRTQQLQGLGNLLESTGIPKTVERAAYAESPRGLLDALTNVNRANVPFLKPETAEAAMTVAPFAAPVNRALMQATKGLPVGASIKNVGDDLLSYRGSHTAPDSSFGAPLYDLTGGGQMYPADVYSSKAAQIYGGGVPYDQKAFSIAQQYKDKPNALVTIYRAVPKDISNSEKLATLEKQMAAYMKRGTLPKDADNYSSGSKWYDAAYEKREQLRKMPDEPSNDINAINAGDWVTLTKEYAKDHGESALKGEYKILSKKVKAKEVFTNADSIHEFGYQPQVAKPIQAVAPKQEALNTAQRNAAEYPLAPAGTRYEEFGGELTYMTPDEYLSRVRPLTLDAESLDNIAALKSHVQSGGQLDPLHIYKSGVEDGRHRAYMAKELGIEKIPVALHTEANNLGQNIPLDALSLLAEQQRKQITGLLE